MGPENNLVNQLLYEINIAISNGKKSLVLWGVSDLCIELMSQLSQRGLSDYIVAIVDSKSESGPNMIGAKAIQDPTVLESLEFDTLVVTVDAGKEIILEDLSKLNIKFPLILLAGKDNYKFFDPDFDRILSSCLVKPRIGGYENILIHMFQALKHIASRKLDGDVVEFGVNK